MIENVMLHKFALFGPQIADLRPPAFAILRPSAQHCRRRNASLKSLSPGFRFKDSRKTAGTGTAVAPGSLVSIFGTYTGATPGGRLDRPVFPPR